MDDRQLAAALPVGYLADKLKRSRVISWGGMLMLVATLATLLTLAREESTNVPAHTVLVQMCACLCLWGVANGFMTGPVQALFADSTPTGRKQNIP
jgi:MFS family permease